MTAVRPLFVQSSIRRETSHLLTLLACLTLAVLGCGDSSTATSAKPPAPSTAGEFVVLATNNDEQGWSAPTDGVNILLPLIQYGAVPATVITQMITSAGALVGPSLTLGRNHDATTLPVAAFDGTNFLVVYQLAPTAVPGDLYGQLISRTGSLVAAAFPITTSHDDPSVWSVTFGGGAYLVTYSRVIADFSTTWAKIVSPNGTVGNEILINDRGAVSYAAFDGTRFLIPFVFRATEVRGVFISPNGTLGQQITIKSSAGPSNRDLLVEFNGTNYLVAFGENRAGTGWDVFAQAVAPSGTLVGAATPVTTAAGDQLVRGLVASGGNFLLSWNESADTSVTATKARFISGSGALLGTENTLFSLGPDYRSIGGAVTQVLGGKYFAVVNRKGATWDVNAKFMTLSP